ncbi:hypothetical protein CoNPh11_CDS0149 [Staphylococcus phage S-CoN_Ph11]|nr:hypothetical protein CoNPh11_CDS0149 [Staphylococcus phage S-CoN_Ph11]
MMGIIHQKIVDGLLIRNKIKIEENFNIVLTEINFSVILLLDC